MLLLIDHFFLTLKQPPNSDQNGDCKIGSFVEIRTKWTEIQMNGEHDYYSVLVVIPEFIKHPAIEQVC